MTNMIRRELNCDFKNFINLLCKHESIVWNDFERQIIIFYHKLSQTMKSNFTTKVFSKQNQIWNLGQFKTQREQKNYKTQRYTRWLCVVTKSLLALKKIKRFVVWLTHKLYLNRLIDRFTIYTVSLFSQDKVFWELFKL